MKFKIVLQDGWYPVIERCGSGEDGKSFDAVKKDRIVILAKLLQELAWGVKETMDLKMRDFQ